MQAFVDHVDVAIVIAYLAAMLWIGWRVTGGSRNIEGFTLGGRELPGWLVGMSVLGTFLSSITFLGVPARVYKDGNWNTMAFGLGLPVAAAAAVWFFIPLYRSRVTLSAYELLEQQFGYWARIYAAASFVVLQLIRVAMVLLLVALAVEPLLHWGVEATLITLGLIVIVYDVMGGIKAVIWTDLVQVIVLSLAAIWCLLDIVSLRPGGFAQLWADLPPGSFSVGQWASWDLSLPTFLVVFLYGVSENVRNYGTDQNYVQRMLCTPDAREAAKSIWLGALGYLPLSVIFCAIGTGLFALYRVPVEASAIAPGESPGANVALHTPLPPNTRADQVFPHFIKYELSPWVRGIVVAGLLAAAMSTVDSCLNSMSTVLLVDAVRRLRRRRIIIPEIVTVRLFTAGCGALGTAIAASIYLRHGNASQTLMELWWQYAGVAGSGLFGLFILAWLFPRLPAWSAAVAVLASIPMLVWGTFARREIPSPEWGLDNCPLHPNLVGIAGFVVLVAIAAIAQLAVTAGWIAPNPRTQH
ncbi:MAG TPA: sodium/solute symporter [Pirellulales bacterium]|nr:sodium/solute symporter [Pirellulales bacterium]